MTWRAPVRRGTAIALAGAVMVVACTGDDDTDRSERDRERPPSSATAPEAGPARTEVRRPTEPTTVVPGEGAAQLAVATTGALFEDAPLVVLAPEDDLVAQSAASAEAVELGMPMLLSPMAPAPASTTTDTATDLASEALAEELDRLGTESVLAIGPPAVEWAEGLDGGPAVVDGSAVPDVEPGDLLGDGLMVVVGSGPDSVAATTTARASGARVLRLASGDPRADTAAIELLTERPPPDQVLAIGSRFGAADQLRRRLDAAATGWQLPGGGQVLFPGRRMIALYGHPGTPSLGVLGEQPLDPALARVQALAREYDRLVEDTDGPVVPAFEIIATVASGAPGRDGNYANEGQVEELRPWIDAAREAGVYVVLDIQPGRTDFLTQAKRYEDLLLEPNVGLALDPEWRLGPDQVHREQVGTVAAAEVNAVGDWLAELTRTNLLPQKLLIVHQFRPQMISGRAQLDTNHDELAVLIHADGFGTHAQKFATWDRLQADPPPRIWWGWKNFIDEDAPTLTPEETLAVTPQVLFVSYQ